MYFLPRLLTAVLTFRSLAATALAGTALAGAALAGCTTSDNLTSSTGMTGSGGSGGAGGSGEAGSSPQSSSSTGIAPCDEDPCKLIEPQCGCEEGLACTVDGAGTRLCVQMGSAGEGVPCSETTLCGPGLICVGYGEGLLSCAKFCDENNQCEEPGGKCEVTLEGVADVKLCSESCDLISNQGCALLGTSCQFAVGGNDKPYTLCTLSGEGLNATVCDGNVDCAPGFVCLDSAAAEKRCFEWCDVGAPACPDNFTCTAYEIALGVPLTIGDVNYGVCNP